jgi:hypothetical protein
MPVTGDTASPRLDRSLGERAQVRHSPPSERAILSAAGLFVRFKPICQAFTPANEIAFRGNKLLAGRDNY